MLIAKYGNGTEDKVNDFEKKYGIGLDDTYHYFLVKYNGGDTPNTSFARDKRKESIRYLFGIETEESIEDNMKYYDWAKLGSIPIGEDCFGNYYTIGFHDDNKGNIYFCDHERGFKQTKVADSFVEFVKKCKSEPIDDSARRTPEQIEEEMIKKGRTHIINEGLREAWKKQYEYYCNIFQEEVIL